MLVKEIFNKPYTRFRKLISKEGYEDRTSMIEHLNMVLQTKNKYVCVTSKKSTGKTAMMDMIYVYYSNIMNTAKLFSNMYIRKTKTFRSNINNHNVIYISLEPSNYCKNNFDKFICKLEERIIKELEHEFKDVKISYNNTLRNNLNKVYVRTGEKFIVLIDEWDYFLRNKNYSDNEKKDCVKFLIELIDDAQYLELVYITGKKPVSSYKIVGYDNKFNEFILNDKFDDNNVVGF